MDQKIEESFLWVTMSYHVGYDIRDYLAILFWPDFGAVVLFLYDVQMGCFVVIYSRSPGNPSEVTPEVPRSNDMTDGGKQAWAARGEWNLLFPVGSNLPPFSWKSLIMFVRVLIAARTRSALLAMNSPFD